MAPRRFIQHGLHPEPWPHSTIVPLHHFSHTAQSWGLPNCQTVKARCAYEDAVLKLVRRLGWKDFEVLVDLILSRTGWARVAVLGSVGEDIQVASRLSKLLTFCWESFDGSSETSMAADKIDGRARGFKWKSPILTFEIERHGGTVIGSTRADRQEWTIDVEKRTAKQRFSV